ncbi:TRANSPOSON [Plasmopara halstedii]|uniref:TRANSPOSON n=1 Tax=Plasmopara halstedii TaxID=4781 RepID=A0A0P1AW22_PLAHL|nr:TRANSPOSON [Plasmopara halstedii]CEG45196.1 TRANSPOSON [Plasmopara halstedii]|eukprot:XP_024581565.1 TRANSPOSON [Plasmopara halstedii]
MANVNDALPAIRDTLDKYDLCDIYNMDETGLFYRMQHILNRKINHLRPSS